MPSLLIVDDDPIVRRNLRRGFDPYGYCHLAMSVREAQHELDRSSEWDGFVIDVRLGDGSGLDFLADVRRLQQRAPAVVITGAIDREVVNRTATLDARFVCKPFGMSELAPFLTDFLARTHHDKVFIVTESARHRWRLTPRETDVLDAALRRQSQQEYRHTSGVSINTLKTQVRHILQKTGYERLGDLTYDLLAD